MALKSVINDENNENNEKKLAAKMAGISES